jgi:hypothetical protein
MIFKQFNPFHAAHPITHNPVILSTGRFRICVPGASSIKVGFIVEGYDVCAVEVHDRQDYG